MAITDCLQRWRERHEFMFFYDLDEFLVLPRHDGIGAFMDEYLATDHGGGPVVALRTQSAWAMFNLTPPGSPNVAQLNVSDFDALPIHRGAPSGREKYWLNTSGWRVALAAGARRSSAPGPRTRCTTSTCTACTRRRRATLRTCASCRAPRGASRLPPALLNTRSPERTQDGRDAFFPKHPVRDEEAGPFVRRMLLRRLAEREARLARGGGA